MTDSASPLLVLAVERSPLVAEALEKARDAHAGQVRNGSGGMPYIEHPQAVATLLAEHGFADEVLAAALLHDVVEHSETTVEELRESFGAPVADLVATLSDDDSIADWVERKDEHRARVSAADGPALAIYGADKLVNVKTLRRTYAVEGEAVAAEFRVPLDLKLEVWEADLELLRDSAPELGFLEQLDAEISRLREDRAAAAPPPGT